MYQIQNDFLSVGVLSKGAELCSIKNLQTDKEYIWQANPEIWNSHAPNLFPIIGALKNGEFHYNNRRYQLPKHGIVRNNSDIKLKEQKPDFLIFNLKYSDETLKNYPFKFNLEIKFELKEKTLRVSHKISNLDEKPMYFSVGGHPAFNAPLYERETYEDYYLEFDQNQDLNTNLLNKDGLISSETVAVIRDDNKIQLHRNLFDKDALIFKNIESKEVALKSKKSGTVLTVEYNDFKDLGIWAKPGAPYVCIEPWIGYADVEGTTQDLKTKEGIMELMPSKTFDASYVITIA
ncbi:aldose 1-epimerase family protein [Gillisia limnaea]|uniref:Aldose 1-epimerase n=1 Tax=Gillisia limnaea (strain DSM 15749 / LMG 21470 / R-8282) TaxID=865937 RepID=H2BRE0_GILLR|nr:aldose 1-epimerase family protein [Gillisia limnaea]EHQ04459.1 Aldose 1-epimerase [Gillisia limnaea DSM 15749]